MAVFLILALFSLNTPNGSYCDQLPVSADYKLQEQSLLTDLLCPHRALHSVDWHFVRSLLIIP